MNRPALGLSWHRVLQPLLICGFFAFMMVRLFADYILPRWELGDALPLSTASVLDTFTGTDEWLRIRINGIPIGDMRTIVERDPEGEGFLAWLLLDIQTPLLRARLDVTSTLNPRLEMQQVLVRGRWTGDDEPDIEVAGIAQQRRLLMRIKTPTATTFQDLPLQRPLTMSFATDQILTTSAIQAGQTYAIDLFDPVWGISAGRMRVRLADTENIEVGDVYRRTRVVEATMPTGQMRVWISEDNMILRRVITFGRGDDQPGSASSLVSRIEIRLDVMTPEEIRRAAPRLTDLPPTPDLDPDDLRGTNEGDVLESIGLIPLLMRSQFSQPRQEQ